MRQRQLPGGAGAYPAQFRMLGVPQLRFTLPRCDDEDVVLGLAVCCGLRLPQNSYLLDGDRFDTYLFSELASEAFSGRFINFAVAANDIPDARIESPTH